MLAMAGLYEIWRDPTAAEDDPDRFRWTCTVLTTEAEDALGHIHDRMPLMVEPERYAAWLDPARSRRRRPARAAGARRARAGSRPTRSRRWSTTCATTGPSCSSRSPLEDVRRVSRAMTDGRSSRRPHGDARLHARPRAAPGRDAAAQPRRRRRRRRARPGRAGRGAAAQRITVVRVEQPWRVAGKKVAPRPAVARRRASRRAADELRVRTPLVVGGRSAGARSAAARRASSAPSGCLALAFPLHPPGRPETSRLAELAAVRVPTLVVQGERDPFGRPEEFPPDTRARRRPRRRPRLQGARSGRR